MSIQILCFLLLAGYGVVSSNADFKGAIGYEILEHRLDHLEYSHEKLLNQIDQVMEKSEHMLDKILASISKIANVSSQILQRQTAHSNRVINSCRNLHESGNYQLKLSTKSFPISIYCDMESFLGGWLVIQQRMDGSIDFLRTWNEYRSGFGTVGESSEFWLGLEYLHQITASGDYELVIELINEEGNYGFARYSEFRIAGESEKYRMSHLGDFTGTIGDGLRPHVNNKFSTLDSDNDMRDGSCSLLYHSGAAWWYNNCGGSSLNGPYIKNQKGYAIFWVNWCYAASFSRMMIRHK